MTSSPRSGSPFYHGSRIGFFISSCHKISVQMSKHSFKPSMQLVVLPLLFVYTHDSITFFEQVFSPLYLVSFGFFCFFFLVQGPSIFTFLFPYTVTCVEPFCFSFVSSKFILFMILFTWRYTCAKYKIILLTVVFSLEEYDEKLS